MAVDQPRPTKVVLADALAELQAREAKLKRLERELAECRAGIKLLRKLVGDTPVRAAESPRAVVAAAPSESAPDEDRDGLVMRIIDREQPCARATLLQRTNLGPGALKAVLDRLRDEKKIRMVGQKAGARYVPTANGEESEAA